MPLPFPFYFYGQWQFAYVSTNGHVNFLAANTSYSNTSIPSTATPNTAIYALWGRSLHQARSTGSVRTEQVGTAPNRSFVIEWRTVRFLSRFDAAHPVARWFSPTA